MITKRWNCDCLGPEGLPSLESGRVDLIIADPPYNGVVKEAWDNRKDYFPWCSKWIDECHRVLRVGGTMWLFGYFRNLVKVVGQLDDKWVIRQQIIIDKGKRAIARRNKEHLRLCPVTTESVVLLVKNGVVDELKKWKEQTGHSAVEINKTLGQIGRGGGKWSCYMNGKSTPTKEDCEKLGITDKIFQTWNKIDGLSDVWTDIDFYCEKHLHVCQKPQKLIRRLVEMSSDPGDLIVDPFMGSGVTSRVCQELNRNFFGTEIGGVCGGKE